MELSTIVNALKADLSAVADVGDEASADAAGRLTVALSASIGLRLLDALSQAALELNAQLPDGRVEVRLSGQDPELVYVGEEPEPATAAAADEAYSARITLRLPEGLKGSLEKLAASEGVSLNTWIVRALQRGTSAPAVRTSNRLQGYARS